MTWRKSSFSNGSGGSNCVEVNLRDGDFVTVRHSQISPDLEICFTPDEWRAFLAGVKAGEFDLTDEAE